MDVMDETNDDVIYEVDDGTGPGGEGLRHLLETGAPVNPNIHICATFANGNPVAAGRFRTSGSRLLPQFVGTGWRIRFFRTTDLGSAIADRPNQPGPSCQALRGNIGNYRIEDC